MNEQEREYVLTEKQDRLLSFAGWAKKLAWVALIIYILLAIFVIPQDMIFYERFNLTSKSLSYWDLAASNRLIYAIDISEDMIFFLLSGAIYYVVLRGISLGLYMIVETDINYTDKERQNNIK